jgi:hypothetical protein
MNYDLAYRDSQLLCKRHSVIGIRSKESILDTELDDNLTEIWNFYEIFFYETK